MDYPERISILRELIEMQMVALNYSRVFLEGLLDDPQMVFKKREISKIVDEIKSVDKQAAIDFIPEVIA